MHVPLKFERFYALVATNRADRECLCSSKGYHSYVTDDILSAPEEYLFRLKSEVRKARTAYRRLAGDSALACIIKEVQVSISVVHSTEFFN